MLKESRKSVTSTIPRHEPILYFLTETNITLFDFRINAKTSWGPNGGPFVCNFR